MEYASRILLPDHDAQPCVHDSSTWWLQDGGRSIDVKASGQLWRAHLETLGERLNEAKQLVILLSSLTPEYELISSILEISKDVTLLEVKEKLLIEYERLEKKEASERALKAASYGSNSRNAKYGNLDSGRKNNFRKGNSAGKYNGFKRMF